MDNTINEVLMKLKEHNQQEQACNRLCNYVKSLKRGDLSNSELIRIKNNIQNYLNNSSFIN